MPEISESMVINRVFYDRYGPGLELLAKDKEVPLDGIKFAQNGGKYVWGVGHQEGLVHIVWGDSAHRWLGKPSLCGVDTRYAAYRYNFSPEPQSLERMCPRCMQKLRGLMRRNGVKVRP